MVKAASIFSGSWAIRVNSCSFSSVASSAPCAAASTTSASPSDGLDRLLSRLCQYKRSCNEAYSALQAGIGSTYECADLCYRGDHIPLAFICLFVPLHEPVTHHLCDTTKAKLVRSTPETFKGLGLSQQSAFCPQKALLADICYYVISYHNYCMRQLYFSPCDISRVFPLIETVVLSIQTILASYS